MQQVQMNIAKKKFIGRVGIIFLIAVVILTFLSKTIYNALMPKVTIVQFVKGSLQDKFDTDGIIEFINKHKIYAGDGWKVKEIKVKTGQNVKKGDLLAILDEKDIKIGIQSRQIEIDRLENNLQSYQADFQAIRISEYERDAQLALREMEAAIEKLDIMKELYESGCETKQNLKDAEDSLEEKQYQYQSKNEILSEKKREAKTQMDEFNRNINEKKDELELKKMEFEKEMANIYEDGRILADMDGLISAVNIEPGANTQKGTAAFEIVDEQSAYRVVWYLDSEKSINFAAGGEVNVSMTVEVKNEKEKEVKNVTVKALITGKEYQANSDRFKYRAEIDNESNKLLVSEAQKARVWAIVNSPSYDSILPKSCITQIQGKDCIYVVKTRPGAMGAEDYVEQTEVEIEDEDDFNVAVNGYFMDGEKVVDDTTKSLDNGMQVHVR